MAQAGKHLHPVSVFLAQPYPAKYRCVLIAQCIDSGELSVSYQGFFEYHGRGSPWVIIRISGNVHTYKHPGIDALCFGQANLDQELPSRVPRGGAYFGHFSFENLPVGLNVNFRLGTGLYYLRGENANSEKMLRALKVRVALSAVLILFLITAYFMGWLQP